MKRLRVSTSNESLREQLGKLIVICANTESNRKLQDIRQLIQKHDWARDLAPCPLCNLPCLVYDAAECPKCRDLLACAECAETDPFYSCNICSNSSSEKEAD